LEKVPPSLIVVDDKLLPETMVDIIVKMNKYLTLYSTKQSFNHHSITIKARKLEKMYLKLMPC